MEKRGHALASLVSKKYRVGRCRIVEKGTERARALPFRGRKARKGNIGSWHECREIKARKGNLPLEVGTSVAFRFVILVPVLEGDVLHTICKQ